MVVVTCCSDIMPVNKLWCQFCMAHMIVYEWIDWQSAWAYLHQLSSGKSLLFGANATLMYHGIDCSCEYSCDIMCLYSRKCWTHRLWRLQMTILYFFGKSIRRQSKIHDTFIEILQTVASLSNCFNKQNWSAFRSYTLTLKTKYGHFLQAGIWI